MPHWRSLSAAAALAVALAACSPPFNWREVRSPDGFTVLLPGRAQTVSREVSLPDLRVPMSMTSTGIGATLFAVGVAQLPADANAQALPLFRDALVRNIGGTLIGTSAVPFALPPGDARKLIASEAIEATGRDAGGRAVRLAARLIIVDDRLFQLVALGAESELPADAADTFFSSFRLNQAPP